ncbi:MAG: cell division protein FtsK [Pirellulales bacterium]|nr:cell division protein FtsK [Pirellulales bacterium]
MNTTRLSTRRELELMHQLQQLADRRAQEEQILAQALRADLSQAQQEFEETSRRLGEEHSQGRRTLENQYAAALQTADLAFDEGKQRGETALRAAMKANEDGRTAALVAAEHLAKESEWQALAVFDAHKNQPQQLLDEAAKRIQARRRQMEGLERDAHTLLQMRGMTKAAQAYDWRSDAPLAEGDDAGEQGSADPKSTAEERMQAAVAALHQAVLDLQDQRIGGWFLENGRWTGWFAGVVSVFTIVGGIAAGLSIVGWIAGALVGAIIAGGLLWVVLPRGKRQTLRQFGRIERRLDEARQLERQALAEAKTASERIAKENTRRRDQDVAAARQRHDEQVAAAERSHAAELERANAEFEASIRDLTSARDRARAAAEAEYPPLLEKVMEGRQLGDRANAQRYEARRAEADRKQQAAFDAMAETWLSGFRAISGELAGMLERCRELFPDWSIASLAQWQRPAEPPEAIRFGECPLPLQLVKHGLPDDKRLDPGTKRLVLPAMMTLAEQPRLVITAEGAGRRAAAEVLRLVMLRFLTAMPAGKLRFTILDPAGLGDNFAAFMHLADYDEQLVGGRIWTDSKQIDQRLALVSEHMEKVLQKYLRNEFPSIDQYNASAGEVSEPYHVVVAANFPAGFSDSAARRLASISQNGPRCGVYTLISVDSQLRLPYEFKLDQLLQDAVHLFWENDRLAWRFPLFEKLPLELDGLPPPERLNEVLRTAGVQSREASRVEVPFAMVAPQADDVWSANSARELAAPIGRAGARELQSLRLGLGTSQHALISGKTGSGKSTLLHALITNLALHYGPDQLEYYLVDFKKGVEFKGYATGRLPHARVIAIESEREFGVSVLERLDQELRRRGELFRSHGVQDLAGFRRAAPDVVMPRTLLVIDEFQELFVADDKLASDAALLLDRLVRQGRAFGIHVMLGSQTLAGAYSLARSTLGQMAVRIALECSEADAHLILSDENTAARLLSRPGEAIYNDQNGLMAGNHPFQVVWLPDVQRQHYLALMRERPSPRLPTDEPTIVFEGNVPADPQTTPELAAAISHPERITHQEPILWLGSAVRIEPATHVVLRRQGGHNLAVVGQDERMAAGMLSTAVVALAAQHGESAARFIVLDGARPESPVRDLWSQVAAAVGESVSVVPPRHAGESVVALADEVTRRGHSPEERFASVYLIVYDLAQFRDLRQSEDDFSFSFSNGKAPGVDKRFREVLKEGPAVGVHVLFWCESYNSLARAIDRLTLREIEFRVAMQMSAADSTSVIDSPAATLLGENRALLYRDDIGTSVKFRPYGPPTAEWLAWAAQHFERGLAASVVQGQ